MESKIRYYKIDEYGKLAHVIKIEEQEDIVRYLLYNRQLREWSDQKRCVQRFMDETILRGVRECTEISKEELDRLVEELNNTYEEIDMYTMSGLDTGMSIQEIEEGIPAIDKLLRSRSSLPKKRVEKKKKIELTPEQEEKLSKLSPGLASMVKGLYRSSDNSLTFEQAYKIIEDDLFF